ncbi:MAG: hypothetical protein ACI8QP_001870 [Porticoccaceae bacterium]
MFAIASVFALANSSSSNVEDLNQVEEFNKKGEQALIKKRKDTTCDGINAGHRRHETSCGGSIPVNG